MTEPTASEQPSRAPTGQPVVVAMERAPDHRAATRWAAREALRRGVPLRVAITNGQDAGSFTATRTTASDVAPGLRIEALPIRGPVDTGLPELSADVGLVVLPASVPEVSAVVSQAYCPVAVVPDTEPTVNGPIVLGAAPWTAENVYETAFRVATERHAPLHAVRLWNDPLIDLGRLLPGHIAEFDATDAQLTRELDIALSTWVANYPSVTVKTLIVNDDATAGLVVLTHRAQLLVLGRSVRGATLARLLGSPVDTVVHRSRCPVLVVPSDGPPRQRWLPKATR